MTSVSESTVVDDQAAFPSLAALREAHSTLLDLRRASGDSPDVLAAMVALVQRGSATGALLDGGDDRRAAQSLLNYWANALYRADHEPPDATLAEFDPLRAPQLPDSACPYLGLDAFGETNAARFFGRQELIARLLERLNTNHWLSVIGPSGSGKSSVVRAGLLPALRRTVPAGGVEWRIIPAFVPGVAPLESLVRALRAAPHGADAPDATMPALETREQRMQLVALMRQESGALAQQLAGAPTVVVVDQFEEIFTLCADAAERMAFIGNLLGLVQADDSPHRVVITMRSDFETYVARVPELLAVFERGRVQVPPLSAAELREAIEAPAAQAGLTFEQGVIDLLMQDILGEPAGLPLLQFTLLKLWEQRDRNRVTLAVYERVGGGRLALARSADAVYASLIPEEQVTARRILLRMVRPGEGLEVTSSRVQRGTLLQGGEDPGRIERVLDRLVDARLVRLTPGETADDDQIEVAHEALVRNWPTLVAWLEEEKSAIAIRRRLELRAADWVRLGSGEAGLLDEVEWREAARWLQTAEAQYLGFDPALVALVQASREATERTERAQDETRERELTQARALAEAQRKLAEAQTQTAGRLRRAAFGLIVLLVIMLVFAAYAVLQQREAQDAANTSATAQVQAEQAQVQAQQNAATSQAAQSTAQIAQATAQAAEVDARNQREIADVQRLAFAARSLYATAPETALLLAYEAATRDTNTITAQTLRDALNRFPGRVTILEGHTDNVSSARWSPDGSRILTASRDGTANIWQADGTLLVTLKAHDEPIASATWSPDGSRILTASRDKTARVWKADGTLVATLQGHGSPLLSAEWSPDGAHILTIAQDDRPRVWNVDGTPVATLEQYTAGRMDQGGAVRAAWSPDGQLILIASYDKTARMWSLDGRLLTSLVGHTEPIMSLVWSSDGQQILTASIDGTARIWRPDGTPLVILRGHSGAVISASWSPDGQTILTSSDDRTARLWRPDGVPLATLQGHTDSVRSAEWSPDGRRILTMSWDDTMRVWRSDGLLFATLQGHTSTIASAIWSPAGRHILSASDDNTARVWEFDNVPPLNLWGHTGQVLSAAWRPDGQQILTASDDKTARVWQPNGALVATLQGHTDRITSATWSPNGSRILTASWDKTARVWQADGTLVTTLHGHTEHVLNAAWSPDGARIATASMDKTARIWQADGTLVATLQGHTEPVVSVAWSPDGTRILTASWDKTARIWQADGTLVTTLQGHADRVVSALWSPDGQKILTASTDGTTRVWQANGTLLATLEAQAGPVLSAAWSPDGQRILTAAEDKIVRVWGVDGTPQATLQGHTDPLTSLAWSPDGQYILTASKDWSARIWALDGTLLASFDEHIGPVNSAAWSPDGRRILTASDDKSAGVWLVRVDDMLAVAACRVGRGLTDEEIQRFDVGTPHFDFTKRQCPPVLATK